MPCYIITEKKVLNTVSLQAIWKHIPQLAKERKVKNMSSDWILLTQGTRYDSSTPNTEEQNKIKTSVKQEPDSTFTYIIIVCHYS